MRPLTPFTETAVRTPRGPLAEHPYGAHSSPGTPGGVNRIQQPLFPILADTAPDSRGEIQLTNGLRTLRGRRRIYAVEFEGKRYDTGEKLGFLKATVEFALARPDLN